MKPGPSRPVTGFMNLRISAQLLVLATAAAAPAAQVLPEDPTAEIRLGRVLPPAPPQVIANEPVGPSAPPPWARPRWYKRSHDYYYYPAHHVYFRPADRVWFYRENGAWRIGDELPFHVRVDFNRAVPLTIENDRPYVYHENIVAYYPADYFDRVQVRQAPDNRSTFPAAPEDDDGQRNERKARDQLEDPPR
jgi:hypothetical protein